MKIKQIVMKFKSIAFLLLILSVSFQTKSQTQDEVRKLLGNTGYILLVEVLRKPADTIEWLGSFKSLWVKTVKDYKGNFPDRYDSIPILIDLWNTHDISLLPDLEYGDELMVFITGTSVFYVGEDYNATISDYAIAHRVGSHDRDGFQIGDKIVAYREFKNAIDSVNRRDKIETNLGSTLARYSLPNSGTLGTSTLWFRKCINGKCSHLYPAGVYVAHWQASQKHNRHIYTYKKGRTRVLAKTTDDQIVARVQRFLMKQDCSAQEIQECLTKVRFHLDHRTKDWSTSWGPHSDEHKREEKTD